MADEKDRLSLSIWVFKGDAIGRHAVRALSSVAVLFILTVVIFMLDRPGDDCFDRLRSWFENEIPIDEQGYK